MRWAVACLYGALAFLAFPGCGHGTFETCLRQHALSRVETRVSYAMACMKDVQCLEAEGLADAQAYIGDVASCRLESMDAGADK
jgi:hypothetical protein